MDKVLVLTVAVSLVAVSGVTEANPSNLRRLTKAQILGFDWKNCGKPDAPAVLKTLTVSPDPISIPGDLTASASGSTSVELSSPLSINHTVLMKKQSIYQDVRCHKNQASVSHLHMHGRRQDFFSTGANGGLDQFVKVNVTLEKEVAGFWVKIPCLEELGSCHYPDACDILNQLIPPGQDCPKPLHTYGLPCRCPFKAGLYSLPQSDFYLPNMDLPYWLTNGNYRVQGVLGSQGQELGCLKVALSLHSD